jgi:undecaprenyl-diphosphatase
MTIIQAIIIAIVEGLTEFLPISSTAHMKFTNPLIGVENTPFTDMFEVVIQFAAILSVVVIFYKKFFDFKENHILFKTDHRCNTCFDSGRHIEITHRCCFE